MNAHSSGRSGPIGRWTLILQSLRYRWRSHLGVVLGAAVGSAALVGALIVGDSVRESLRALAMERLGRIEYALAPLDRFVTGGLIARMQSQGAEAVSQLRVMAVATREDHQARASQVHLIGVATLPERMADKPVLDFWSLGAGSGPRAMAPGEVWLNEVLARQLRVSVGDTLVFRLRKPTAMSLEAPLTSDSESSVAVRWRVGGIQPGSGMGNFSLRPSQVPPRNAFVRLEELQGLTTLTGLVNTVLLPVSGDSSSRVFPAGRSSASRQPPALRELMSLADYEASLRRLEGGGIELISRRIFLEEALVQAVVGAAEDVGETRRDRSSAPQLVLTYLVNLLRAGTNATPYSMVTAAGPPWTPADLGDDEIVINEWLSEDLGVRPGDFLELVYFLPESASDLREATNRFRVRSIVPLAGPYADRTLMPDFPGLARAESTQDWDSGFPLVHRIRVKDEDYWKKHRGTPKAFVSPAAGQRMWSNRFGVCTSVRLVGTNQASDLKERLEAAMLRRLEPRSFGLEFEPVRQQALAAAEQSQDFGGLFLGFSLFLIVAALLLMATLFQFGVEQRAGEIGVLLALGFRRTQARLLFLCEGGILAVLGSLIGTLGGGAYAYGLLRGLATIWREAVGTSALVWHARAGTMAGGFCAAVAVCVLAVWLTIRRQASQPARELLAGYFEAGMAAAASRSAWGNWGGWLCLVAAVLAALWPALAGQEANPAAFFGAGSLFLVGSLMLLGRSLSREGAMAEKARTGPLRLAGWIWRGCARRRRRSLAVVALLGGGVFLVSSIGVFRLDANRHPWKRSSGTGGFALVGQSTLPIVKDLNTSQGREDFGLDHRDLEGVAIVPFRVREGDDASCLNLNRAQKPRLLGVDPELLRQRGAFTFVKAMRGQDLAKGWGLLHGEGDDEVPAVGDAASIQWALGKKVGDTLDYVDEWGRPFRVRLVGAVANSILQGQLVISEQAMRRKYPGESGFRFFLVDTPSNRVEVVSAALSRALEDKGLELVQAADRLNEFNAVQNTYLGTFQILGAIGLLIGGAGLGVVVLRNTLERRSELALLLALGFRRDRVRAMVVVEHGLLLGAGLLVGVAGAGLAVFPATQAGLREVPWVALGLTWGGIILVGLATAWLAARSVLRGSLLEALRSE